MSPARTPIGNGKDPELALEEVDASALLEAERLIGKFILHASYLDMAFSSLLTVVLGMHASPFSEMVVHSVDLNRKREILRSFAGPMKGNPLAAELNAICDGAGDIASARNAVAHGLLFFDDQNRLSIGSASATAALKRLAADIYGGSTPSLRVADIPAKIKKADLFGKRANDLIVVFRDQVHPLELPEEGAPG